jgi:hypothetical protein
MGLYCGIDLPSNNHVLILPTGYIYPRSEGGLLELARQRRRLVQQFSSLIRSVQNQVWRPTAVRLRSEAIKSRATVAGALGFLSCFACEGGPSGHR